MSQNALIYDYQKNRPVNVLNEQILKTVAWIKGENILYRNVYYL